VQRAKLVGGARIKLHITIHQREEKQEKETTTVQSARANKKLKNEIGYELGRNALDRLYDIGKRKYGEREMKNMTT